VSKQSPRLLLTFYPGQGEEFHRLLDRLRTFASQHHRDHWWASCGCPPWLVTHHSCLLAVLVYILP
jgi:broad specificity phosphatase PhoE